MQESNYVEALFQSFSRLNLDSYALPSQFNDFVKEFTGHIIADPNKQETFTDETKSLINQTFDTIFVCLMCTNGYIKTQSSRTIYQTFSANAIRYFLEQLGFFLNSIPTYVHELKLNLAAIMNKKTKSSEEFIRSGIFLLKLSHPIKILSGYINVLIKQNKDIFNILPNAQHIPNILKSISNTVVTADAFVSAINSNQDTTKLKSAFLKESGKLKKRSAKALHELTQLHKTMSTFFTPFSQVPEVIDFFDFISHYTHSISGVYFLSIQSCQLSAKNSSSLLSLLNQIVNKLLLLIISIQKLLNFQCNSQQCNNEINEMNHSIINSFKLIIDEISQFISLGTQSYQKTMNNQLVTLFTEMIGVNGEFSKRFETIYTFIKKNSQMDQIFDNIKIDEIITPLTEPSSKMLNTLRIIMRTLLGLDKFIFADLVVKIQHLSTDYTDFVVLYDKLIKNEGVFKNRIVSVHKKVVIEHSMQIFVKSFSKFNKNQNSTLLQITAGLSALNFALAFCTIDTMTIQFPILDEIQEILITFIRKFFIIQYLKLKNILNSIIEIIDTFPLKTKKRCDVIVNQTLRILDEENKVFKENKDLNPKTICLYINSYRKIYFCLTSLVPVLEPLNIKQDVSNILTTIKQIIKIIQTASYTFSWLINLYLYHLSNLFCTLPPKIESMINGITSKIKNKSSDNLQIELKKFKEKIDRLSKYLETINDQIEFKLTEIPSIFSNVRTTIPSINNIMIQMRKFSIGSYLHPLVEQTLYGIQLRIIKADSLIKYESINQNKIEGFEDNSFGLLINEYISRIHTKCTTYIQSITNDKSTSSIKGYSLTNKITSLCNILSLIPKFKSQLSTIKTIIPHILQQSAGITLGDMFYQKQTIELIDKYLKISQQVKTIAEKLDDELCGETKTEQNKTSSKDIKLPNLPKLPNIETKQQQFPSASLPTKKNMLNVDKKKEDTTTKEEQVKKENETKNFQIKIESNEENEEEIRKKTMSIFQSEFLSACNDGNDELQENIFKNIQHNNGGVLNSILFPELNKGDCEPIKIDLSNTAFVFAPPPPPLISREIGEKLKLSRKNINEMKELSEEIKLPLQELKRNPKDIKLVKKILEAENRMQNCIKCIEKELNALESEKSDKAQ